MAQKNTAQDFIPIKDIRDGVVVLRDGKLCMLLLVSTVNFALKSADEQRAILSQFQGFLNTLEFSVQIYIQSRRLDIRPYLSQLQSREKDQYNDLMRIQLREYMEFIRTFTQEVEIMTKNFFVVVPYTPISTDIGSNIKSVLGKKDISVELDESRFTEYRTQLEQRVNIVRQGLAGVGLKTVLLESAELTELFYHLFNPHEMSSAPQVDTGT
ncbi:hypothetical protein KTR10_00850 [Candidatus Kaiserbacteria bacterium]|nr:hypothetical protein [Candidatus Kaiserbacteria bacterium]